MKHAPTLITVLAAAACSSSHGARANGAGPDGSTGGDDADMTAQDGGDDATDDASGDSGQDSGTVMPPPCGITVGKTLCDVSVEGHIRDATTGLATSAPYGSFHLSDMLAKGTEHYAMVFLGAFW
jgi:hypothetical protein